MRTNGGPTWRHVAAALGTGILIGRATTNNFYSLQRGPPVDGATRAPSTRGSAPLAPTTRRSSRNRTRPWRAVAYVRRKKRSHRHTQPGAGAAAVLAATRACAGERRPPPGATGGTPQPPQPLKAQSMTTPSRLAPGPLENWDLHASNARCPSSLKVYVYEYPGMKDMVWHRHAEEQRRQCAQASVPDARNGEHLLAQFTLEHRALRLLPAELRANEESRRGGPVFVDPLRDILCRARAKDDPSPGEQTRLDLVEKNDQGPGSAPSTRRRNTGR